MFNYYTLLDMLEWYVLTLVHWMWLITIHKRLLSRIWIIEYSLEARQVCYISFLYHSWDTVIERKDRKHRMCYEFCGITSCILSILLYCFKHKCIHKVQGVVCLLKRKSILCGNHSYFGIYLLLLTLKY